MRWCRYLVYCLSHLLPNMICLKLSLILDNSHRRNNKMYVLLKRISFVSTKDSVVRLRCVGETEPLLYIFQDNTLVDNTLVALCYRIARFFDIFHQREYCLENLSWIFWIHIFQDNTLVALCYRIVALSSKVWIWKIQFCDPPPPIYLFLTL